jgi:transposase
MPERGSLDRKAAASLAGHAPRPSQSGLSHGRNAISGGRPCLRAAFYRAAFYMAALNAVRHHPRFKQIYLDLRAAGKPAKVALVAIAALLSSPTPSSAKTSHSIKQTLLDIINTVAGD